ncbi:unnamed protein product [Didymodactylos carnosus]|uniref:Iron-binding zinc finger CDGSH type domain-containing protein n=1 Tax=Didymodactylos carnosus TaxID=1234261 RepID=A0A814MHD2_9BILA|nr:unnamed protein product [Didymodactylos carnosus]CAF1232011.1 unnamed protein product [Didymodactylos carnosus]CAF3845609.1 unnamed protein product [Didymodactylos carnosus]CAF4040130.1 unnamed protein product [Didymodactylos carnosus]
MDPFTTSDAVVDQSKKSTTITEGEHQPKHEHINKTIRKDVDKLVDKYDIEDVITQCNASQNKTVSYCRCWKSKKFPLCDGSHNAWNKETGDNLGPLVITNKP